MLELFFYLLLLCEMFIASNIYTSFALSLNNEVNHQLKANESIFYSIIFSDIQLKNDIVIRVAPSNDLDNWYDPDLFVSTVKVLL